MKIRTTFLAGIMALALALGAALPSRRTPARPPHLTHWQPRPAA